MERVVAIRSVDPELVRIEARRLLGRPESERALALPDRLERYERPLPGLASYDSLLEANRCLA
jgi:hypothetical protein